MQPIRSAFGALAVPCEERPKRQAGRWRSYGLVGNVRGPDSAASARELPTGTVTFLFTDVEGSTQRWERDREAMGVALRRHDALIREALEYDGGYVFKTVGDAFCAVFSRPREAVAAALRAQRALAAEDFSAVDGLAVRMAITVGTADERDGDYFGPAVNRVARLLGCGHGAQVLVAGAAADLLHDDMPERSSLLDLGVHHLKDLERPEHVYQVVAPDMRRTFPVLRSLDALANNLPRQLTSFVGRDADVAEISTLVAQAPLVTLVGTGGVGKTRCAIHVGALLLDGSGDGVWFVELAPLGDASLVPGAIAQTLGVQESPNRPLMETLGAYLKRKRMLVILDNCEHVIAEVRAVAATLLRTCAELRILATSRESLNISGERIYRMPSLALPPVHRVAVAASARSYGALALFADRALASDSSFALTDENAPVVTDICRRLDGIPLALELAAARINVLSPSQLALRLDERFRVLTGGDRTALPRQQTMRALIDWSYDLLGPDERQTFRKLAIFPGGFTLETAAAVCADAGLDEFAALEMLGSLVDKSLVHAEPGERVMRYNLLESTRQYAREKLAECGEYASAARAHALAYVHLAERLDAAWETTPDRTWFAEVEPEVENWRAALAWSLDSRGDVRLGQQLAGAICRAWRFFGVAECRRYVLAALENSDVDTPPAVFARLAFLEARRLGTLNQSRAALEEGERALARCRNSGDPLLIADLEMEVSHALIGLGRTEEGEALMHAALATARRLGARKSAGEALLGLAKARYLSDDIAGSRARFAEALDVAKATGYATLAAQIAGNLAEAEFRGGDVAAALETAAAGLADHSALKNRLQQANNLCNAAAYLTAAGRFAEAQAYAREALPLALDVDYEVIVLFSLQHLAAVAALRPNPDTARARDDCERAARLFGYVAKRLTAVGAEREYTEQSEYDRVLSVLARTLGSVPLLAALAQGEHWDEERAVTEAILD